jgi:hypothetical protein
VYFDTSVFKKSTFVESSLASAEPAFSSKSPKTIFAPAVWSRFIVAAPMPLAPPVLSVSRIYVVLFGSIRE